MQIDLNAHNTKVALSGASWERGIHSIEVDGRKMPFLLPAMGAHHFFTGVWPLPSDHVDYEPHEAAGRLERLAEGKAEWHQPETAYSKVEIRLGYEIVEQGVVDLRFETTAHAESYPLDYVGVFFGAIAPLGGQRGLHLVVEQEQALRWRYFQAGGDCWTTRENAVLGPGMESSPRADGHPPTYYFAESATRFALPIQVARWRDLYWALEVDDDNIAFADVLMGTAVGGPSWDVFWRLKAKQQRTLRARLTVRPWRGWEEVEERYRGWEGCLQPDFSIVPDSYDTKQAFAVPVEVALDPGSGLQLSRRLYEERGRKMLEDLDLLSLCSVGCVGNTSQNAGVDDASSRDHIWGPYLSFFLPPDAWDAHGERLQKAVSAMPDEVDGVAWNGYGGPEPRWTRVWEIGAFMHWLTGYAKRPALDEEWLPYLQQQNFLGRRWTERLFDAGQGVVFHDPQKQFTDIWRHWVGYPPPNIHKALVARSLFRVWNAGPEYNLTRIFDRGDAAAFAQCRARFVDEVMELACCWNERYVPAFKWRVTHFARLPICPVAVREGLQEMALVQDREAIAVALRIVDSVKLLMKDLYHLPQRPAEPLSVYAHAVHASIEDEAVREATQLNW